MNLVRVILEPVLAGIAALIGVFAIAIGISLIAGCLPPTEPIEIDHTSPKQELPPHAASPFMVTICPGEFGICLNDTLYISYERTDGSHTLTELHPGDKVFNLGAGCSFKVEPKCRVKVMQ